MGVQLDKNQMRKKMKNERKRKNKVKKKIRKKSKKKRGKWAILTRKKTDSESEGGEKMRERERK